MKRTILLGFLGLAVLGAIIIPTYACFSGLASYPWVKAAQWSERKEMRIAMKPEEMPFFVGEQNFAWGFQHNVKRRLMRWWRSVGFPRLELSEGFQEKVIEIAESDEDVQALLDEGYNVTAIKPVHVKMTVQEDGQVTIEVDRVLLLLTKDKYDRAIVLINFEAEKVVKIVIVTAIDKTESP